MKADSTPDVFTFLRFPLALSVVFIHSVGTRLPDLAPAAGSAQWGYDLVRLTFSHAFNAKISIKTLSIRNCDCMSI